MARDLFGSVVVITGAGSGIGRATALQLASRGAGLVLAGRRKEVLDELAVRCQQLNGSALAFQVDVTDEAGMKELARAANEYFGHIDAWVNNAGVGLFGRFDEVPPEDFRRVIETNLFGCVNGSRAVLPYFKQQGHGVLINVSSVVGEIAQPFTSAYVTSKWAVRGLSESLRMELRLDGDRHIHVCTVMPAAIDTPFFQHAANYTGRQPKPMRPIYDPEKVAKVITSLIVHPKREVFVGGVGPLASWQHRFFPSMAEATMARQVYYDHFSDRSAARGPGSIWEPMPGYETTSGNWKTPSQTGGALLALGAAVAGVASLAGWMIVKAVRGKNGRKNRLLPLGR